MDNKSLVVKAQRATLAKTRLGGLQVVYPCPRCKDELTTKNDVSLGDTCPSCNTSFEFDAEIKDTFAKFEAHKKQQAEALAAAQAAAQAEKERIRQAQKSQQEKARAEALSQEQLKRNVEREEAAERERKAELSKARVQEIAARDVSGAYGCLGALLGISFLSAVLVVLGSMAFLASPGSFPQKEQIGIFYFVYGLSCFGSLVVLSVFFKFLFAMHRLLVAILDRLDSSSK
jgi:hypothetical protein